MYVLYGLIVPVKDEKEVTSVECKIHSAFQKSEVDLSNAYFFSGLPTLDNVKDADKFGKDIVEFLTNYKN